MAPSSRYTSDHIKGATCSEFYLEVLVTSKRRDNTLKHLFCTSHGLASSGLLDVGVILMGFPRTGPSLHLYLSAPKSLCGGCWRQDPSSPGSRETPHPRSLTGFPGRTPGCFLLLNQTNEECDSIRAAQYKPRWIYIQPGRHVGRGELPSLRGGKLALKSGAGPPALSSPPADAPRWFPPDISGFSGEQSSQMFIWKPWLFAMLPARTEAVVPISSLLSGLAASSPQSDSERIDKIDEEVNVLNLCLQTSL